MDGGRSVSLLAPLTDSTEQGLLNKIAQTVQTLDANQTAIFNSRRRADETGGVRGIRPCRTAVSRHVAVSTIKVSLRNRVTTANLTFRMIVSPLTSFEIQVNIGNQNEIKSIVAMYCPPSGSSPYVERGRYAEIRRTANQGSFCHYDWSSFGDQAKWSIYLAAAFCLCIAGWQASSFVVGLKLRNRLNRARESVKTDSQLEQAPVATALPAADMSNFVGAQSVTENTTELLQPVRRPEGKGSQTSKA